MSKTDIVTLLRADHEEAKRLLGELETIQAKDREDWFRTVASTLVRHEVAEEEIVYPQLRGSAPNGGEVADARLAEQAEAEQALAMLEKIDPSHPDFVPGMAKLRADVLDHATHEEREVFPLLEQYENAETRGVMGERYQKAKEAAPTHPHPHSPDRPPGNILLGPIAATVDRVRDVIRTSVST